MGASDTGNPGGSTPAREESPPSSGGGNGGRSAEAFPETRETIAHFEPSVPPAAPGAATSARPFVVWSSAPAEKPPAEDRGPDE